MLASLDKDDLTLRKQPFDLGKQIKDIIFMLEWRWRTKELAVEMDVPNIQIHGDENLLYQVWMNLFTNSIKFTESGGTIAFAAEELETEWRISISDMGIGIPENEIKKIFDRFHKVDTARNRNVNGSGLGLSIVKKVVDLHGGAITVDSELEKGTTFSIYLPKQQIAK